MRAQTIGSIRNSKSLGSKNIKEQSSDFYQSTEWRNTREKSRDQKRTQHEKIVMQVYENNPDINNPDHLIEFLQDEKKYPLSEQSLRQGKIRRATVCDHIKPIKNGGAKLNLSNLQWLTLQEHKEKTRREQESEKS